jgi:hypothetical protein
MNGMPKAIEVRVDGRRARHLIDYDALPWPEHATPQALCSTAAHAVMELRAHLVEAAILEGHDRIEVQIEGDLTTVHYLPSWWTETRAWIKVQWARWKHRRGLPAAPLLAFALWLFVVAVMFGAIRL